MEELAVEHDHNCQDKLPVEELSLISSQLPRQATRERALVNIVTIAKASYPWKSSPLISSQFPRLATVDELASNISTIA